MQKLLDLPALVAIFLRFFWQMFCFAERMFRIADCFAHDFQCLHHSIFLSQRTDSVNDANVSKMFQLCHLPVMRRTPEDSRSKFQKKFSKNKTRDRKST